MTSPWPQHPKRTRPSALRRAAPLRVMERGRPRPPGTTVAKAHYPHPNQMRPPTHLAGKIKATLAALLLLAAFSAQAQLSVPAVKGKFFLYIDDSIHLFLNGTEIFALERNYKATQTKEIELKPGDRVVARLRNGGGPRAFQLLFASSDFKQAVRFTNATFKILPNPDATDFSPQEVTSARVAKQERNNRPNPFPFKTKSEWVWGEMDACTPRSDRDRRNVPTPFPLSHQ